MKDFCPYCHEEVEYYYDSGDYFCPNCGRNKSSALHDTQIIEKAQKKAQLKNKLSFWSSLLSMPLGIVWLTWLYYYSERTRDTFFTFALPFLIFCVVDIFYLYKEHKKNKS